MKLESIKAKLKNVIENMPEDWLKLTTHRLDIYNEAQAKTEFINHFEEGRDLDQLPTAFDYIRLGHPLSCVLEWAIASSRNVPVNNVTAFSSRTMPILAILRKNHLDGKKTQIIKTPELPACFDQKLIHQIYGYDLEVVDKDNLAPQFDGVTISLRDFESAWKIEDNKADFEVCVHKSLGSVIISHDESYNSEIQHVRRRESIAMTPHDCLSALKEFTEGQSTEYTDTDRSKLDRTIKEITNTHTRPSISSCGLSAQYAIMMGLIDYAHANHNGKDIKFIVPPNCYGGTNDQARRVAACLPSVEIIDLAVDRGKDMVSELDLILEDVANLDAVPYIIAEIPTNPRVEVPDLKRLKTTLSQQRKSAKGQQAIAPVFILDQTFCPDVKFLGDHDYLGSSMALSYVSGSKFPSGGLCTAGYVVANNLAKELIGHVEKHLQLCDNGATNFQIETLTAQMPSMVDRIKAAYKNTREFVSFIKETLPDAKINFVSQDISDAGFTPSVFSLDLPTKGDTAQERESYKRQLNQKLISIMINEIPGGSKHCVSYGQLKGSYWTIPATSTQGTTKEGDKDYIVRVSLAPELDLNKHKEVFKDFCVKNIY